MPIAGAKTVSKNITRFGGGFINHVNKTMGKVAKIIDKEATKNLTASPHYSQDQLTAMGHPYARKYGPQGMPIHDPYWQVHKQSGQLLSSKSSGVEEASIFMGRMKASAFVKLDEQKAPHALEVIYGTSKMIPRDVLRGSLLIQEKNAFKVIATNLKDLVVRFRSI